MARLNEIDVDKIIEMIEDQLDFINNIDRTEKMKMRSKIRKQACWLLTFRNPSSLKIFNKLEEKLSDIFRLHPYGFSDELKDLLEEKIRKRQISA
jgi:hypothetical protein